MHLFLLTKAEKRIGMILYSVYPALRLSICPYEKF